jgi:hypothetical protein
MGRLAQQKKRAHIMQTLTDICESGKAPSGSAVAENLEARHMGISRSYVQATLLSMAEDGQIERKAIGAYSYYRPLGSPAEWPIDYNKLIFNAVVEYNKKGILPTSPEVARVAGCSADQAHKTLRRIGQREMGYKVKAVRRTWNTFCYVANLPEFAELGAEKAFSLDVIPRISSIGTAIGKKEIAAAKARTKPGDVVPVERKVTSETTITIRGSLTVKYVMPHICVFESGDSVNWGDMAMYYRTGSPLTIIREGKRCTI